MTEKFLTWLGFGDAPLLGGARSSQWPETKRRFALLHPKQCTVFGCKSKRVQLHHKISFATHPELENHFPNLVWLCQGIGTPNHHFWWGHLGSWHSLNIHLQEWIDAVRYRPKWSGTEWEYQEGAGEGQGKKVEDLLNSI